MTSSRHHWKTFARVRHVWLALGAQVVITAAVVGHSHATGSLTRLVWLFPLIPPVAASVTSGSTVAELEAISPRPVMRASLVIVLGTTLASTAIVLIGAAPWLGAVSAFDLTYLSITGAGIAVVIASRAGPWLGWIPASVVIGVAVQILRTDGAVELIDPGRRVAASIMSGLGWVLAATMIRPTLPLEADPERDVRYRAVRRR